LIEKNQLATRVMPQVCLLLADGNAAVREVNEITPFY
jgi:hypothetical protein